MQIFQVVHVMVVSDERWAWHAIHVSHSIHQEIQVLQVMICVQFVH